MCIRILELILSKNSVIDSTTMKLKHTINIDFLEFFKTGKFDYLKIGQNREWIKHNFPDPEDWGCGDDDRVENARIWRYGNIELHFDKDLLWLIFSDYIGDLDGGEHLVLDKWILAEPDKLTLGYVVQKLLEEAIAFELKYKMNGEIIELHLTESTVVIGFCCPEEEQEKLTDEELKADRLIHYRMVFFSLSEMLWKKKQ